ncbi:hypothetical protein KBP51_10945 [Lactiplantibacillus pentosus]|nr:hypothetical protein [Lactiplantibacillus pentosus]MBQ0836943.1 hypothetical protein [Lactiplantibacillus pentosus]
MQRSVVKKLKQALIDIGNLQNDASQKVTLALSVSDKRHRASVKFYRGDTFNDVWQSIATVLGATSNNSWVRLDIVQGAQVLARKLFEEKLFKITKMNFWRYGVSFDADFRTALLETEINGQAFFKPSKESRVGDGHANSWADYEVPVLHQLMHRRSLYEIQAGAWLPEIAMYLYWPEKFVGGFYARDDNFRTRIDDSEHFLSGLVNYYNYTYRQA